MSKGEGSNLLSRTESQQGRTEKNVKLEIVTPEYPLQIDIFPFGMSASNPGIPSVLCVLPECIMCHGVDNTSQNCI